jgi:hypothetical protein
MSMPWRSVAFLLAFAAICRIAAAQQSPAVPQPAPLLGLDGRSALDALPSSAPIAHPRADPVAHAADEMKSLEPPRPPVDPQVLR